MPLDERDLKAIRNALVALSEERIRLQERIKDLVLQSIKCRQRDMELETYYDELADVLTRAKDSERPKQGESK